MAISKYKNFDDYADNDPYYLLKVLKGELHEPQSKIQFLDGSTYHVTKSGSRYWQKGDYIHRENGPASSYVFDGIVRNHYYLFSVGFETESEYESAVARLEELRSKTDNQIEHIMNEIAKNIDYSGRSKIWKTLLRKRDDDQILIDLKRISEEYSRLTQLSAKFIDQYSSSEK